MSKKCQEDVSWPPIIQLHSRLHSSGHYCPCKDLYHKKVQFSGYVQYDGFFYCFYITIKTFSTEGDSVCCCLLNAKGKGYTKV